MNSDPGFPPGETKQMQKQKQEELLRMYRKKEKDAKKIERLMVETFPSQRRDILSGTKETEEILKEWPFLFQENGMRVHFKELTGVQIDNEFEESTITKFRRVLRRYFQLAQIEPSSNAGIILSQTLTGGDETCAAVMLLLAHFKEQQDKLFVNVDDTAIATDVDTTKLPWTPCLLVCGKFYPKVICVNNLFYRIFLFIELRGVHHTLPIIHSNR